MYTFTFFELFVFLLFFQMFCFVFDLLFSNSHSKYCKNKMDNNDMSKCKLWDCPAWHHCKFNGEQQ